MYLTHFIVCDHIKSFWFQRKHQMHSLLVELHIHRKKQTEDDSFNFLNVTKECENYWNLTSHLTSWLFSRNSLTALRATLQAASFGYPYIPVEIHGKAWDHWIRIDALLMCVWDSVSDRLNIDKDLWLRLTMDLSPASFILWRQLV